MTSIVQLPTITGIPATSTCDSSYYESGRACAWNIFLCDEYTNGTMAGFTPALIPTCFDGSQQSPINLDVSEATVGDPGQITFSGFDAQLSLQPVYSLKSYALQLELIPDAASNDSSNVQLPTITGGALGENT